MRMQREILTKVFCAKGQLLTFKILLNPFLKEYIIAHCRKDFDNLETDFNVKLEFKEDNNLHIENFKIVRA